MAERNLEVIKFGEIDFLPSDPDNRIKLSQIGGGVLPEIAENFGVDADVETLDGLDTLIKSVAPDSNLRENIAHAKDKLGPDAIEIARDWVQRTGLLELVERSFMKLESQVPDKFALGVIFGGLSGVIDKRTQALLPYSGKTEQVLMLGGNGRSGFGELTQSEYLGVVIRRELIDYGFESVVNKSVASKSGNDVMKAGVSLVPESGPILIASNAGNWLQIASQFRRAMRETYREFDEDGSRLFVVSGSLELGLTGQEPSTTHQHPLSAIGSIVRNLKQVERSFMNE